MVLLLAAEGPHQQPPRVPQGQHRQVHPHPLAANAHQALAKVSLELPARRGLKPHRRQGRVAQLPPPRLHGTLHRPQADLDSLLTGQLLPHHIGIAAVGQKPLPQPLLAGRREPRCGRACRRAASRPAADTCAPSRASSPVPWQCAAGPSLLPKAAASPPHPEGSAPPSPQPSAPEMAPLRWPCRPAWLAPRGGPVFVSPPDQFSLSPDTSAAAMAAWEPYGRQTPRSLSRVDHAPISPQTPLNLPRS